RFAAAVADPEAQVLAVADRADVGELAAVDEQDDARVADPERSEATKLGGETKVELGAADDGVDMHERTKRLVREHVVAVRAEGAPRVPERRLRLCLVD